MSRVLHYRLGALEPPSQAELESGFSRLAEGRTWSGEPPWLATPGSGDLFAREYLRHVRQEEGEWVGSAGYLKLGGDEIDALIAVIFLRDASAQMELRVTVQDDLNPLAKLRRLEFVGGRLPSGNSLEEMLARRPVIKKVDGQSILFYPPAHRLSDHPGSRRELWGYGLMGIRAYAPNLPEAEHEALKFLRAMRHLGP
ncbi:MAG TPA: hypothetical protein VNI34_02195 [Candidatus Nitrosotalea sp.]|nr:hypothetical protein [Candidatus Nitrosotalea sp.]